MDSCCARRELTPITPGPVRGSVVSPTGVVLMPGVNVNLICLVRKRCRWFLVIRFETPTGPSLRCPRTRKFRISRTQAIILSDSGVPRCCTSLRGHDCAVCTSDFFFTST